MTKLENAVSSVSSQLELLSVAHVTVARHVASIVKLRELRPRHCDVFGSDLLYFSYGAPYYRPRNEQTEDALEFPVALLFDVSLLDCVRRFYPFDTGALMQGIFGDRWKNELGDLDEHYVRNRPDRLVSCLYGSNAQYLRGEVRSRVKRVDPLPQLRRFLSTNMAARGVDGRQRTIECVIDRAVSVLRHLRWIGYPSNISRQVRKLWDDSEQKFKFYGYPVDVNENPAALVTLLAKEARREFLHLHEPPPDP